MDLFDLNEPKDLYKIILQVYDEYSCTPTERNFLFLVLGFTHLREWISESSYYEIRSKKEKGQALTDGEHFFEEIYLLPSFRTIQELCNRGKHHVTHVEHGLTSKVEGFQMGLGKMGDSLGQMYFLIDGEDSRDYFFELVKKYNEWFGRAKLGEHKDAG